MESFFLHAIDRLRNIEHALSIKHPESDNVIAEFAEEGLNDKFAEEGLSDEQAVVPLKRVVVGQPTEHNEPSVAPKVI